MERSGNPAVPLVERCLTVDSIQHVDGRMWRCRLPELPWGDTEEFPVVSTLEILEDGSPLGPAHSLHADIAAHGQGRYSHWGHDLFFSSSEDSPPPQNGRIYSVRFEQPIPPHWAARLMVLAGRLGQGRPVERPELIQVLSLPDPGQRAYAFEQLGIALLSQGRREAGIEQLRRAWRLGRTLDISLCIAALQRAGAFQEIWDLLARAALQAAETGDAATAALALRLQHDAIYAAYEQNIPSPGFQDPVIAATVRRLLSARRPPLPARPPAGPRRIGYILAGETGMQYSSLPDIVVDVVLAHDRSRIEPVVLTLHSPEDLAASPFFAERQGRLVAAGIPLLHIGEEGGTRDLAGIEATARRIAGLALDALVPMVLTGSLALLAMLRPAPRILTLGLGEIHMYSGEDADLTVHFSPKPAMDAFSPSVSVTGFVPSIRLRRPERVVSRADLSVPEDAFVIIASGRPVKFRSPAFWRIIAALLAGCDRVHVVLCGIDGAFLDDLEGEPLPQAVRTRIHALGWRNDILEIYPSIDAVIDTVPNGGGYSLYEPMNLEIPPIGFHDDPLEGFQEKTWMPAMEHLDFQEATFDPTDLDGILFYVTRLATDPEFRVRMGKKARLAVQQWRDPSPMVRALEGQVI